jgi:hypothetical protein
METPLDIRAWVRGHDGRWHWLDVGRFDSDLPAADLLLPPPTVAGRSLDTWPPGRYRFELLDGAAVRRLDLTLDPAALSTDDPVDPVDPLGPDTGRIWPVYQTVGPYVVEDSVVHPLAGRAGRPLTPGEAWLATDRVASEWRPRASALGVLLPPGPRNVVGVLHRVEPDASFELIEIRTVGAPHPAGSRTTRVEFAFEPRAVFPPGLYAIDLAWDGPEGHQSATWYVELRPAPTMRTSALLRAARRYAVHAGTQTLILSGAGRREPDADRAPVRVFPIEPSIGCGLVLIDQQAAVLGFGHAGQAPADVLATVLGEDGRGVPVPVRVADAGVPGLTLVEPARGAIFPEGIYAFHLEVEDVPLDVRICLGTSPFRR